MWLLFCNSFATKRNNWYRGALWWHLAPDGWGMYLITIKNVDASDLVPYNTNGRYVTLCPCTYLRSHCHCPTCSWPKPYALLYWQGLPLVKHASTRKLLRVRKIDFPPFLRLHSILFWWLSLAQHWWKLLPTLGVWAGFVASWDGDKCSLLI